MKRYLEYKLQTQQPDFVEMIDPQATVSRQALKVFGGCDENYTITSNVVDLNMSTRKTQNGTLKLDRLRVGQSLWQLPQATVLFGGRTQNNTTKRASLLPEFSNAVEVFDLRNGAKLLKVQNSKEVPAPRQMVKSVAISDDQILIIGGNDHQQVFEDIFLLTVGANNAKWAFKGKLSDSAPGIPFGKFSLCLVDETVYLFGGVRKRGEKCQLSRQVYSLKIDSLTNEKQAIFAIEKPEFGKMIPVADHEAVAFDNRYMIVIGGETVRQKGFNIYTLQFVANTEIWCYDTLVQEWFQLFTNVVPRIRGKAVARQCDVFIFGGLKNNETFNTTLEIITFQGFKLDKTCEICKNVYNLNSVYVADEDNNKLGKQEKQTNIKTSLFYISQLTKNCKFDDLDAIGLLIDHYSTFKATQVSISLRFEQSQMEKYVRVLQLIQNSNFDPSLFNFNSSHQYVMSLFFAALKLGQIIILINPKREEGKNSVIFLDASSNQKSEWEFLLFDHYYGTRYTKQKKTMMMNLKQCIKWEDIFQMQHQLKNCSKLLVFSNRQHCPATLDKNEQSKNAVNYLSRLYLQSKIKISFNNQAIQSKAPLKFSFITSNSQLIQSIRCQESQDGKSQALVYHKGRLIYKQWHIAQLGQQINIAFRMVMELQQSVKINIFKNRIEDPQVEVAVQKAIEQAVEKMQYAQTVSKRSFQDQPQCLRNPSVPIKRKH